jgi:putative hydrolase of the HAD superfamily
MVHAEGLVGYAVHQEAILNLIFDLGGVVFTWEPEEIINRVFADPAVQTLVRTQIFNHADWSRLDRGTLLYPEAIVRAAERTGLPASAVARLFRQIPLSLVGLPESVALLRRLKMKGHRLFYLSNMHVASMKYIERAYTFWDVFEGGVMSCRVHLIKPEPKIFNYLTEQYGLNGTQTIFIDDMTANLEPAERIGIQTIKFDNPIQCEYQLEVLGCV